MNLVTTLDPAERFTHVIDALCRAVAGRSRGNAVAGPLIILLCHRLGRVAARFTALVAALRNGAFPPAAPAAARPACRQGASGQPASGQPASEQQIMPQRKRKPKLLPNGQPDRLPKGLHLGRGWLVRLVPEAAVSAGQLRDLLADPDMAAAAQASPPTARMLRSLCWMLAVDPSPLLPPLRRRPPTEPAPKASRPAASTGPAPRDAAAPDTPEPVPKPWRRRLVRPAWDPPWGGPQARTFRFPNIRG